MGRAQRKQPLLLKESIGPVLMGDAARPALFALPLAQQIPKAPPHPTLFAGEGGLVAMFEILKPALQCPVEVFDDDLQAMTASASRLGPNRVPEFLPALLPRPFPASVEAVTQKVKTLLLGIHYPGLDRMQRQTRCRRPFPAPVPRLCSASSRLRHSSTQSSA